MNLARITHRGHTRVAPAAEAFAVLETMIAAYGAYEPGRTTIVPCDDAPARVAAQHEALRDAGIALPQSQAIESTTVADYADRHGHANRHLMRETTARHATSARDAFAAMSAVIAGERRRDREVTPRELAAHLSVDSATTSVRFDGLALSDHALRGLATRIEAPGLYPYLAMLRPRRTYEDASRACSALHHELTRAPHDPIVLRTREGNGDVYATVSPAYAVADWPSVADELAAALPQDARATVQYDPDSTSWEARAHVWTPTPAQEHVVGEAFEGYISVKSRDDGLSSIVSGGGITMLVCLNSATRTVDQHGGRRVHRGRVSWHLGTMIRRAARSIDALVDAWGIAREATIEVPLVPLEQVLPGLFSAMLNHRELVNVLPGRTATHAQALASIYPGERRDQSRVVKSDLAQAYTRYIQRETPATQRDAESAIAAWMTTPGVPALQ